MTSRGARRERDRGDRNHDLFENMSLPNTRAGERRITYPRNRQRVATLMRQMPAFAGLIAQLSLTSASFTDAVSDHRQRFHASIDLTNET